MHRDGDMDSNNSARRVHWLTLYTSVPMGQQTYETSIQQAILDLEEPGWDFRAASVGSGRSEATHPVPQRVLNHPAASWVPSETSDWSFCWLSC